MSTSERRPLQDRPGRPEELVVRKAADRRSLHRMLMRVPASVAILSGPQMRIMFANHSYRRLLAIKGKVIGRPFSEVVPDIEPVIVDLMLNVITSGERFEARELPVRLDWDGSGRPYVRHLDITYEPMFDDAGRPEGLTVFAHDVSPQVVARRQAEEGRGLLQLVADAMPSFVAYIGADRRFQFANQSYEDWFAVPMTSIAGQTIKDVVGAAIYRTVEPYVERVLRGENVSFENELQRKDGTTKYIHTQYIPDNGPDGRVRGYVVVGSDITERKLAEIRLRSSESRFRFMAESMPQKIFTVLADGTVSYFNPQWQQYTGVPLSELLHDNTSRRRVIHRDDYRSLKAAWLRALQRRRAAEHEFRMLRHDGEYRWHIGRMQPMKDDQGGIVMWIGSVTDIDDLKRGTQRRHELEIRTAALTQQRSQLLALNQAKDEFISLASHQLRTPATGVKQFLGMMLEGYAGAISDDQRVFLETAYDSNERQINIVNDLLQVARLDAGKITLKKHKTDVSRLVKSAVNEHTVSFAEHDQQLVLRVPLGSVKARLDPDRIRMTLDNIIDNAGKYSLAGTTVTITVRQKDDHVTIAVADQGVGMSRDELQRIFQKFSRLENPRTKHVEGSGLGLYWARKIIDLHGGKISVKSSVGKGTTFTIKLPQ